VIPALQDVDVASSLAPRLAADIDSDGLSHRDEHNCLVIKSTKLLIISHVQLYF
jgi:hypothetical protein